MSATRFRQNRPLLRGTGALAATTLALTLLSGCGGTTDEDTPPGSTGGTSESDDQASAPGDEDSATETEGSIMNPPDDGASATALPTNDVPARIQQAEETQAAVADLAEREGVEESAVKIVGYREVTWRSGAIGCPEEGKMYTMALVPGRQLILAVDDTMFAYNATTDKPYNFCAAPEDPAPAQNR